MATRPVSFTDVALHADQCVDYDITVRDPGGAVTVVALHGGALAPGTAELAEALAGDDYSLYAFVAREDRPALRISSLRAREPRLDTLIERSMIVLSIDGDSDTGAGTGAIVRVGGANAALQAMMLDALCDAGFQARPSETPGIDTSSAFFFNRAREGGLELALSATLLEILCAAEGCDERRALFVSAVRESVRRFVQTVRSDLARALERFENTTARIPPEIKHGPGRPERNEGQP
ncbi:MAG: poly-gamma-glutamate hydrolase family protein [Anaerolineae bacterium]